VSLMVVSCVALYRLVEICAKARAFADDDCIRRREVRDERKVPEGSWRFKYHQKRRVPNITLRADLGLRLETQATTLQTWSFVSVG
jgi:hypothetical protein